MSTEQWAAPEAISTVLSTDLNSLANTTLSAVSAAVDNETDRFGFVNYEIVTGSITPATGGFFVILFLPTLDGTNFYDANISDLDRIAATIVVETSTSAKRIGKENCPLPPLKGKFALYNASGVALPATGNTLKIRRHKGENV